MVISQPCALSPHYNTYALKHTFTAELATALLNDKSKWSSDVPLFYGTQGKDTVTPQQLMDRIDKACTISNWGQATGNEEHTLQLFPVCLIYSVDLFSFGVEIHNTLV